MSLRQFIGLIGSAASVGAHAARDSAIPDSVQKAEQDFPLVIASMPATGRHQRIAVGIVIHLIIAAHRSLIYMWPVLMPSFRFCRPS
jgi:hypothetical protein